MAAKLARPLGVSVLSVFVMLFGLFTALLAFLEMQTGFVSGVFGLSRGVGYEFLGAPAGLVIGIAYFVSGVGLWNLRRWAWWLALLAGIVGFVLAIGSLVGMIVWGAVVAYLVVVRGNFGAFGGIPQATGG